MWPIEVFLGGGNTCKPSPTACCSVLPGAKLWTRCLTPRDTKVDAETGEPIETRPVYISQETWEEHGDKALDCVIKHHQKSLPAGCMEAFEAREEECIVTAADLIPAGRNLTSVQRLRDRVSEELHYQNRVKSQQCRL